MNPRRFLVPSWLTQSPLILVCAALTVAGTRGHCATSEEINRLGLWSPDAALVPGLPQKASATTGAADSRPQIIPASVSKAPQKSSDTAVAEDRPPQLISSPAPKYPAALQKAKTEGVVTLKFVVNKSGSVVANTVEIVSSPDALFSAAAKAAVQKWKFKPGTKGGVPVDTWMQVPLKFRISATESK